MMNNILKFSLCVIFLFPLSFPVFGKQGYDVLNNLEFQRLQLRKNPAGDKAQLLNLTSNVQAILEGTKSKIDFQRKATDAEFENTRLHVLNTTIINYKSTQGLHLEMIWDNFNKYVFSKLNEDLLNVNHPQRHQYLGHLTTLYIMGMAAFELVKTPRAYFSWNNAYLINHIVEQTIKNDGLSSIHPLLQNYIPKLLKNAVQEKDKKDNLRPIVEKCLGNNFYKNYFSLMHNIADTPEADQILINIAQEAKKPLYEFNNYAAAPVFPRENAGQPLMDKRTFTQKLKLALDKASSGLGAGQNVHTFNKIFVVNYRDKVLQAAEQNLNPDKQLSTDQVKTMVYEYYERNKDNFENLSANSKDKEVYKKSLDKSFTNLATHLKGNTIEGGETNLNMPEIISAVWDVSIRLQQLKDKKKETLLQRLQTVQQTKPMEDFNLISARLDDCSIDLRAKVIGTIAENALTGGGCYPGLAGRFFSDYCHLLIDFYQADDQYFDIHDAESLLTGK